MNIPLDEVIYFDIVTSNPTTGAAQDADSTPTFEVFEESTDTDIGVGGNFTKRTSKTGNYRGSFTISAANGFEVGKWYNIIASATVDTIDAKSPVKNFRVVLAESIAGVVKSDTHAINGNTTAATNLSNIYSVIETGTAQAGGSNTITLRSGASSSNDYYNNQIVVLLTNTGAGQNNRIIDYVGSTRVATVATSWVTQPDNTTTYLVIGRAG